MRIVLVYREHSEDRRWVEEFLHDYQARTGRDIEVMDPDSPAAISFCSAYDIMRYPALIAIGNDGTVYEQWNADNWPQIDTVSGLASL